jgi:hypothetical protein
MRVGKEGCVCVCTPNIIFIPTKPKNELTQRRVRDGRGRSQYLSQQMIQYSSLLLTAQQLTLSCMVSSNRNFEKIISKRKINKNKMSFCFFDFQRLRTEPTLDKLTTAQSNTIPSNQITSLSSLIFLKIILSTLDHFPHTKKKTREISKNKNSRQKFQKKKFLKFFFFF